MNDRDAHSQVVRWVKSVTGTTTIKAYESGTAPATPYNMVNMLGTRDIRAHEQVTEYADQGADVKATPVIEVEWSFSVHAYGSNPTDNLRGIRSAAKLSQVMEPMLPSLTVHEVSQIRHVPDWINNQWQPRAQLDLFVRGLTRDGFLLDVIEQTEFNFERV
ncbi:phage neck terminator protein [Agrobacterium sp. 22-221-1]